MHAWIVPVFCLLIAAGGVVLIAVSNVSEKVTPTIADLSIRVNISFNVSNTLHYQPASVGFNEDSVLHLDVLITFPSAFLESPRDLIDAVLEPELCTATHCDLYNSNTGLLSPFGFWFSVGANSSLLRVPVLIEILTGGDSVWSSPPVLLWFNDTNQTWDAVCEPGSGNTLAAGRLNATVCHWGRFAVFESVNNQTLAPTPAPTEAPAPTRTPTNAPTSAPPTSTPTSTPTSSPTNTPTAPPTPSPTILGCQNGGILDCVGDDCTCLCSGGFTGQSCEISPPPTQAPTKSPTASPTPSPTVLGCQNGGILDCVGEDCTCLCSGGFTGQSCEITP
jgi:hypothetical protein